MTQIVILRCAEKMQLSFHKQTNDDINSRIFVTYISLILSLAHVYMVIWFPPSNTVL